MSPLYIFLLSPPSTNASKYLMYVLSKVPSIALQNQIILKSVLSYINADKANIIFLRLQLASQEMTIVSSNVDSRYISGMFANCA